MFCNYTQTLFSKLMKHISINHLQVIRRLGETNELYKIKNYEKFLLEYVSMPTARKIIKELIQMRVIKVIKSKQDLRVKLLEMKECVFTRSLQQGKHGRNRGCRATDYSHSIVAEGLL